MHVRMPLMLAVTLLAACSAGDDPGDPRLSELRDGELPADNLIIYDRGRRKTIGMQVLGASGSFELAGPTVVYVFRSFNPGDIEAMQRDGIRAEENTAYLLPSGAAPTLEALQGMQRIGPIDPAMSDEQLALGFRLGEAGAAAASTAPAPPPDRPKSAELPVPTPGPEEEPTPGTVISVEAAGETLDRPATAAPTPGMPEDPRMAELGSRLNAALATLASEMRDGTESQATRGEIRDIQLELQALVAEQGSNASARRSERPAVEQPPIVEPFNEPATATCASYTALDKSAPATASINAALTAYAEGFAGALIDYEACAGASFDAAGYVDHLASFCAARPDKTIRNSVIEYACGNGL